MKLRFTPLNIFTSILLISIAYLILNQDKEGWRFLGAISLLTLAVLSFITDIIFRRLIKDTKRIWIIELVFIIFAAILLIIIKK